MIKNKKIGIMAKMLTVLMVSSVISQSLVPTKTIATEVEEERNLMEIKKTKTAPVIDGVTDESTWEINNKLLMELSPGVVEEANFGMNYDDKNLYVAFNIKDEELVYDENISWFLNDCVGIFIDPTLHQSAPFKEDDLQIGLVYQENSSTPKFYFGSAANHANKDEKNILRAISKTEDGWSCEVAIPWDMLNIDPNKTKEFGFNASVTDKDSNKTGDAYWSNYKKVNSFWNNTSGYGIVKLSDEEVSGDISNVLLEENFDNIENGQLPTGWISETDGTEGFKVENGQLIVNGNISGNQARIFAPVQWDDYEIEADLTFLQVLNSSRWASIIFRAPSQGKVPYNQMAIRQNGSFEIAERTSSGAWSVPVKGSYGQALELNKKYNLKVRVCGNNVKEYIKADGEEEYTLLTDNTLDSLCKKGKVGFQVDQSTVAFDNLKVTKINSTSLDVNIPDSMQALTNVEDFTGTIIYNDGISEEIPMSKLKITSSDESIIQIVDNKIWPLKEGKVNLTFVYNNQKVVKIINVTANPDGKKVIALSLKDKYILANTNEGIDLNSILLEGNFNDLTNETLSLADCTISDDTGNVEVKNNKLYVKNKGITNIKITKDEAETNLLVVSKNAEDSEYVLYEENFDNIENGQLPNGWTRLQGSSPENATVQEGAFILNGKQSPNNPSRVMLPEYLMNFSNYKISVDSTCLEANEGSRWNSVMYRIQENNKNQYYQMAIRQNATASNGVEFAQMTPEASWNVTDTASFKEALDNTKMYNYEIKVHGSRVQEYIDGNLMIDTNAASQYTSGGIGFQANGSIMKVDNIKITLQEEELPKLSYEKYVDVKEINEKISLAPTSIVSITNKACLSELNSEILPANAMITINENLDVMDYNNNKICSLDEFMKLIEGKVIPCINIENETIANKLVEYLKNNEIEDVTVISEYSSIIKNIRTAYPIVRGVLKFNDTQALTDERMFQIVKETNISGARTALISDDILNNDTLEYMQRRLITVWSDSNSSSKTDLHKVINAGVNGIITNDFETLVDVISKYDENTLVREPFIIGHRGIPSKCPENTLESAIEAYKNGADMIENDIYLTKDNEIVIMHDDTVDRTTNGTGRVEDFTLAELKELSVNKQYPDTYPDAKIPTLREFFEEFKDKDVLHFIELKTSNPNIVPALKELVDEMGVENQIVTISFLPEQLQKMNEIMPGISVGYLNGVSGKTDDIREGIRKVFNATQKLNATYNPSYGCINKELLEELKHRGMTSWPWTYNNYNDYVNAFKMGVYGLTTNYSNWSKNWLSDLLVEQNNYNIKVGETFDLNGKGLNYLNERVDVKTEIVPIENDNIITIENNNIKAVNIGKASVMLKTIVSMDDSNSYTLYSEPVEIKVNSKSEETNLKITSFTTNKPSPQQSGEKITLKAEAVGEGKLQYKFLVTDGKGNWYKIKDFSESNTAIWTPCPMGKKSLFVDVKDETGKVVRKELKFEVTSSIEIKDFTAEKVSETKVNLKASASGTGKLQYKFIVRDTKGNWYKIKDFSDSNTAVWNLGPNGEKTLYVDVKNTITKEVIRKSINYIVE